MQNKVRIKKIKNDKIFKAEKSPATVFDFKLRSRFKFLFFTIMQNIFFTKKITTMMLIYKLSLSWWCYC